MEIDVKNADFRVLVADDDEALRLLMRHILRREGCVVMEASDGQRAVESFRRHAPQLVVIDMVMPEKSGLEAMMEMTRINARVPVIAVSGGGRADGRDLLALAAECGAAFTLAKPFLPEELRALVRRCRHGFHPAAEKEG